MPFSSSNENNNNNNSDSLNQNSKLCISTAVTNPASVSYESKGLKRKLDKSPLAATPSASMSKTLSNMNNSDEETYDYDEYNENSFSSDSLNDSLYSSQNRANSSCGNLNAMAGQIRPAPTLATGRKSKDTELPPDEARKRQDRRERNKEAAARCRRKREDLTTTLTKVCLFSDLYIGGMMREGFI
jgi:fos-like antigen